MFEGLLIKCDNPNCRKEWITKICIPDITFYVTKKHYCQKCSEILPKDKLKGAVTTHYSGELKIEG